MKDARNVNLLTDLAIAAIIDALFEGRAVWIVEPAYPEGTAARGLYIENEPLFFVEEKDGGWDYFLPTIQGRVDFEEAFDFQKIHDVVHSLFLHYHNPAKIVRGKEEIYG